MFQRRSFQGGRNPPEPKPWGCNQPTGICRIGGRQLYDPSESDWKRWRLSLGLTVTDFGWSFYHVFLGCFFKQNIGETNHNVNQQEITLLMGWDVLFLKFIEAFSWNISFFCRCILKTVLYFMRLLPYLYTKKNGMRMMHNDKTMPFWREDGPTLPCQYTSRWLCCRFRRVSELWKSRMQLRNLQSLIFHYWRKKECLPVPSLEDEKIRAHDRLWFMSVYKL